MTQPLETLERLTRRRQCASALKTLKVLYAAIDTEKRPDYSFHNQYLRLFIHAAWKRDAPRPQ